MYYLSPVTNKQEFMTLQQFSLLDIERAPSTNATECRCYPFFLLIFCHIYDIHCSFYRLLWDCKGCQQRCCSLVVSVAVVVTRHKFKKITTIKIERSEVIIISFLLVFATCFYALCHQCDIVQFEAMSLSLILLCCALSQMISHHCRDIDDTSRVRPFDCLIVSHDLSSSRRLCHSVSHSLNKRALMLEKLVSSIIVCGWFFK